MAAATRQQAITWTNIDQDSCRHMASQGHNEFSDAILLIHKINLHFFAKVNKPMSHASSYDMCFALRPENELF